MRDERRCSQDSDERKDHSNRPFPVRRSRRFSGELLMKLRTLPKHYANLVVTCFLGAQHSREFATAANACLSARVPQPFIDRCRGQPGRVCNALDGVTLGEQPKQAQFRIVQSRDVDCSTGTNSTCVAHDTSHCSSMSCPNRVELPQFSWERAFRGAASDTTECLPRENRTPAGAQTRDRHRNRNPRA